MMSVTPKYLRQLILDGLGPPVRKIPNGKKRPLLLVPYREFVKWADKRGKDN